jgi:tetratricopeptide (TPR) repeat protein
MRTLLGSAFIVFLLCAGCGTLKKAVRTDHPGTGTPVLGDGDIRFAKALAHYGQGLLCQDTLGVGSPEAVSNFEAAVELDPHSPRLYPPLAVSYICQKKNEEALEVLRKACRNNPGHLQATIDLAVTCEKTGHTQESIDAFRKAIKMAPGMDTLYRELALIYFRLKKNREAFKTIENGIKKADQPEGIVNFCYNFGKLYESVGLEEKAVEFYSLAAKSKTGWPDPFVRIAAIYMKSSMPKALKTIDNALDIMPDEPKLLFLLALLYSNDNQFNKAMDVFQKIEKNVATNSVYGETAKLNAVFYVNYGSACERAGQLKKAEEVFEKCLKMYPDSHEVLNYLAYMWAEQGVRLDESLKHISRALELDPGNGAYIDTLGWVYYKQKKYDKALEQIQKAHENLKDDPTIIEHLGDIYYALNNREKAVDFWTQSFRIDPKNKTVMEKLEQNKVDLNRILREIEQKSKAGSPSPRQSAATQ